MREWRPMIGHPHYEVSNDGQVRSVDRVIMNRLGVRKRRVGVELKATPTWVSRDRLYRRVRIDGKNLPVAHLVLTAFVGTRPDGHVVRHLNDDSLDDRLENLSWGTRRENGQDCVRNGRSVKRLPNEVTEDIKAAWLGGESQRSIAKRYGVSQHSIYQRIRRATPWVAGIAVAGATVMSLSAMPVAKADGGIGCLTERWGFLGSQLRTICDAPRAADGSWTRERRVWTSAGYVPGYTSCGTYSCSSRSGYYRQESTQAYETYPVTDATVLGDEPGWLPTGTVTVR